jgi:2-hydroxy-3-keto-5-methylthiopentenyl-1-phosphate phosphatase
LSQLGLDNLEVFSGHAKVRPDGIRVNYTDPSGSTITSGFKESYVRHFRSLGHTVVCIGDGLSDVVPALEADFAIARSTLQEELTDRGVPHFAFETFNQVGSHMEELRLGLKS